MHTRVSHSFQMTINLDRGCPCYDQQRQVCTAAIFGMVPSRRQQMRYCAAFDYDNCPSYLGKALRSSRSQGLDRESIIESGK